MMFLWQALRSDLHESSTFKVIIPATTNNSRDRQQEQTANFSAIYIDNRGATALGRTSPHHRPI